MSSWRGGWARTEESSREARVEIPEMGREKKITSLPAAKVFWAAARPPPPAGASLLSSSQIPIVRTLPGSGTSPKERRLGRGVSRGYLPFFSCTVQHGVRGACEGTRAHTRAHTHTRQPRSRPPRPPPLRTSSCQNAALDPPIPPCSGPRAGFATNQQFGK